MLNNVPLGNVSDTTVSILGSSVIDVTPPTNHTPFPTNTPTDRAQNPVNPVHPCKSPYPSCRNRGSNRSLNQSPKKFNDITVKNRAVPGITEVHQAVCK